MPAESVLIVEDERIVARDLQAMLQQMGYRVPAIAATGAEAIARAAALCPDLVLMDIRLQGPMDGIEAAAAILTRLDVPVIYLTAFTDEATRRRARQTAPYGYLVKPFDERTVQTTIEMALERHTRDRQARTDGQWLAATLASLGDAIVTTDAEGRITFANPAAERFLRRTHAELLGSAVADVVVLRETGTRVEMEHPVLAALHGSVPVPQLDARILIRRDGTETAINGSVASIQTAEQSIQGSVLVFQQRAARQHAQAEDQRAGHDRQIQRLRVLASGIAHDFNNLLMGVLGNAELARSDIPEEHPAHEALVQIARAAHRGADIASELRAYAGDAPIVPRLLDLNELVYQTVAFMLSSTLIGAAMHLEQAPDLPYVEADAEHIRRAVQHLLANAAEAIGEQDGVITITTYLRYLSSADLAAAIGGAGLPPGWYAAIQIGDTGSGMDEATRARIFEPFYSTKFLGRGLGLPAVLGIVRQHSGAMIVRSAPRQGSAFTILLPCAPAQPAS